MANVAGEQYCVTTPTTVCTVGPHQEPASNIPGNIGRVRATVKVWEHDPFWGRPFQEMEYTFAQSIADQSPVKIPNLQLGYNTAFLKPEYRLDDVFVATINANLSDEERFSNPVTGVSPDIDPRIDLVGSTTSAEGTETYDKLPGGKLYNNQYYSEHTGRNIFPHQLWIHVGSLLREGIPRHPSEYTKPVEFTLAGQQLDTNDAKFTREEIENAATWIYSPQLENGVMSTFAYMQKSNTQGNDFPVHWTLEKFTPTWQGEDFIFTFKKGDMKTDDVIDPYFSDDPPTTPEIIDTDWPLYKYLLFHCENPPPSPNPTGAQRLPLDVYTDGISNEAYYVSQDEVRAINDAAGQNGTAQTQMDVARKRYWWKYKSYLLIEIGHKHPEHNYFIELVKGRSPRLIHLGEEWDTPLRAQPNQEVTVNDFTYMKKARVLSEFEGISCDDLFSSDFQMTVQNNLNRLIITFNKYPMPWIVQKLETDPARYDLGVKTRVPIVVPAGVMRIHGGNLTCMINFSPLRYAQSAIMPYYDREVDAFGLSNRDVFLTLGNLGTNEQFKYNYPTVSQFYGSAELGLGRVGFVSDAYVINEYVKNTPRPDNHPYARIYEIEQFNDRYRKQGRGWIMAVPFDANGVPQRDSGTNRYKPHKLINGSKKRPFKISVVNLDNRGSQFPLQLLPGQKAGYQFPEHAAVWNVGIELTAGDIEFPKTRYKWSEESDAIEFDSKAEGHVFMNVMTPIATGWRMVVLGGQKPIQNAVDSGEIDCFDMSLLVTKIEDSWSADGYTTMNHEMNVTCYIPWGVPVEGDAIYDSTQQSSLNESNIDRGVVSESCPASYNVASMAQKILKLHNKTFYVTVSYWWEYGVGERDAPGNKIERNGHPSKSDLLIQMTGMAYGAQLERSVNKVFMSFTVKDYMSVLQNQYIFNSPFFDAVDDVLAIRELARMAGFDDSLSRPAGSIDRRPLGFLQHVLQRRRSSGSDIFQYNGETTKVRRYDLKGSYASIAEPAVRFNNGDSYDSAMKRIAQMSGKTIYFDRWGVLRYESSPATEAAFNAGERQIFTPKFHFVSTPFGTAKVVITTGNAQGVNTETVIDTFTFNSRKHASHLVYNVVRYSRSVEDAVNQIILFSASNDILKADGEKTGGFIIEGYTFFDQIFDPNAEGFIGYRKPFYQSNGVFGGIDELRKTMLHYSKMKYPIATISFETFGVPGLKPLDIVALDGNLFYITEISHDIDPAENRWWMNVKGEWLKPFEGSLGFLTETGQQESGTPGQGGE